jgi:hypothetical protein
MAEVSIFQNHDYQAALSCVKKSQEYNAENIEWRIILGKLVLESCAGLMTDNDRLTATRLSTRYDEPTSLTENDNKFMTRITQVHSIPTNTNTNG